MNKDKYCYIIISSVISVFIMFSIYSSQLSESKETISVKEDYIKELKNTIEEKDNEISNLKEQIGQKDNDIEELKKQINELEEQIDEPEPSENLVVKYAPQDDISKSDENVVKIEPKGVSYVLNTSTKKFHLSGCSSVSNMKSSNRKDYTGSRDDVINMGYTPCQKCNP